MKKVLLQVILLLFLSYLSFAQRSDYSFTEGFTEKAERPWFVTGNFGLQIGSVTIINAAPAIGYRISEKIAFGTGLTYQYYRYVQNQQLETANIFGASLFARTYLFKYAFLHFEMEALTFESAKNLNNIDRTKERIWLLSPLVGAGYRQLIGDFTSFHIIVLWNLNQTEKSIYSNPVFRLGFDIQL